LHLRPALMLRPGRRRRLGGNVSASPAETASLALARAYLSATPVPVAQIVYEGKFESDPQRVASKIALRDMEKLRDLTYAYAVAVR
jgi:hypothetical protein